MSAWWTLVDARGITHDVPKDPRLCSGTAWTACGKGYYEDRPHHVRAKTKGDVDCMACIAKSVTL